MGFEKGHKKIGGRKKGSINKNIDLFAICDEIGINVFKEMALAAAHQLDPEKRFGMMRDLAPYLYAKKKESTIKYSPEQLLDMAEAELNGSTEAAHGFEGTTPAAQGPHISSR